MNGNGPLLTISDAAKQAGITKATIYSYIQKGYLPTHMEGFMVYYRDLLRASWTAKQLHLKESGKSSPKYKQKKKSQ